ncbi:MAG: selenide, water dikinase SelD, partial [Methylococcales bacterium]|nr:selenide, water dikinase SelD [Methylococcales bacterium]
RASIQYDALSINCGITPDLSIPGAAEFSIPVKPIAEFYPKWQQLLNTLKQDSSQEPHHIAVVGGGAAGVELILAIQYALSQEDISRPLHFHLVQMGQGLPETYPEALQRKMAVLFSQRSVTVHDNFVATEVSQTHVIGKEGQKVAFNSLFWCANAAAAPWPKQAGLATDDAGFIAVNSQLQSTNHPDIFAAGDIASLPDPRPKAGVFAVRQGGILYKNLKNHFLHKKLRPYIPQKRFLSLIACGDKYAMGCKKGATKPTFSGKWVWYWKDHIDQKFMRMFSELSPMAMILPCQKKPQKIDKTISGELPKAPIMRCGGCGAKVGATILSRVLAALKPVTHSSVIMGIESADDSSAIQVDTDKLLIQSIDHFRAIIDDPYQLGQIAALHALSDIFAMNATPHSALAIATLPHASENIIERDLSQLMQGAISILNEHQCALIGGHSSEGEELSIGFSINAFAQPEQLLHKNTLQAGDKLILTKPLGTGVLFAAHAQLQAQGTWIQAALEQMLQANKAASNIFSTNNCHACTDITGFGLLGHLVEMLKSTSLSANIKLNSIPALPGALESLKNGISSTLQPQNIRLNHAIEQPDKWQDNPIYPLLFDPQTSGGLLASISSENAEHCIEALHQAGYQHAVIIGSIIENTTTCNTPVQLAS